MRNPSFADLTPPQELPAPNLPLLRKVLDHIDAHPEEYAQQTWATSLDDLPETVKAFRQERGQPTCGTVYCIAGHAVAMTEGVRAGEIGLYPASGDDWETAGCRALGLSRNEGDSLFNGGNTRAQVQAAAERIAARAGERL